MNLSVKHIHNREHGEQPVGFQGGRSWGRDRVGGWGQQMPAFIYIMALLYNVEKWVQYPMINYDGKEYIKKECVYINIYMYVYIYIKN